MTDRELLELLLSKFESMETDIKDIKVELNLVSEQTAILTEFKEETVTKLDKIENKLDDIDVKNANRHLDFIRELRDMKHSISRVEINTAENWRDIAKIKAARKYKTK